MENKTQKAVIQFVRYRMLIGAIIGFAIFFLLSVFMLFINGWFADDVAMNPYLGPPPMMTAGLIGFIGSVIGALLSFFSKRWKKFK